MTDTVKFWVYLLGVAIIVAGLSWAAALLGVPNAWIGAGVLVVVGFGVLKIVKRTPSRNSRRPHDAPGFPRI